MTEQLRKDQMAIEVENDIDMDTFNLPKEEEGDEEVDTVECPHCGAVVTWADTNEGWIMVEIEPNLDGDSIIHYCQEAPEGWDSENDGDDSNDEEEASDETQ